MIRKLFRLVLGFFLFTALLLLFIYFLSPILPDPVLKLLLPTIGALLVTVWGMVLRPARNKVQEYIEDTLTPENAERCRILVAGHPRSGKTSFIRRILTVGQPKIEKSTEEPEVYNRELPLDLHGLRTVSIQIRDYKGQKPSQLMLGEDIDFYGPTGNRLINALILIVDLVPELKNDSGDILTDSTLLDEIGENAESVIQKRVEANLRYLSEWTLEPLLSLAFNPKRLLAVHLVINKIDIVRRLTDKGYLSLGSNSAADYALTLGCPKGVPRGPIVLSRIWPAFHSPDQYLGLLIGCAA